MKKVVVITGDQLRHDYFRIKLSQFNDIDVLASFCESNNVLQNIIDTNKDFIAAEHLKVRNQSELDFFGDFVEFTEDKSNPIRIQKNEINGDFVVERISLLSPDLIISFGCSIIKSSLLDSFKGRFINLHLGLSPYYRGSGTNFWPFVNKEPEMCGVTFMHINSGVDTGDIIHQQQAIYSASDHPIHIGNRLIKDMINTLRAIIINFEKLESRVQPAISDDDKIYKNKDFTGVATAKYYQEFSKRINDFSASLESKGSDVRLVKQRILK